MAYRRTARIVEQLAGRRADILRAAREIAAEQGLAAVQIVPVAERVGIAAGTVYRYFPSKSELVEAVLGSVGEEDVVAIRAAADAAPGPASALAAAVLALAASMFRRPGLVAAALSAPPEPAPDGPGSDPGLNTYRIEIVDELEGLVGAAARLGELAVQDLRTAAAAVVGALLECAIGPLPAAGRSSRVDRRGAAQAAALFALRALGMPDARARGLIVQTRWPTEDR